MPKTLPKNNNVLLRPRTREADEFRHITDFEAGKLIPLYSNPLVLPGDTWQFDAKAMIKSIPMTNPIIGSLEFCCYAFFVPWRIIWDECKEFFGENNTTAWTGSYTKQLPYVTWTGTTTSDTNQPDLAFGHAVGHYLGLPYIDNSSVSIKVSAAIESRSYAAIWNEYFRNQNLQGPKTYLVTSGHDIGNTITYLKGGCFPVNKKHDVFSGCIPSPQKGTAVNLPFSGLVPVVTNSTSHTPSHPNGSATPIYWSAPGDASTVVSGTLGSNTNGQGYTVGSAGSFYSKYAPSNLYANIESGVNLTVQDLRNAAALQQYYESMARNGSKYYEMSEAMFGVRPSNARLDLPEFIGGFEEPLNITTVTATANGSAGSDNAYLGQEVGKSVTFLNKGLMTYTATEHGTIMVVGFIRQGRHMYGNRLDRHFIMSELFEQYFDLFSGTGDVPVYSIEAYFPANGSSTGLAANSFGSYSTVAALQDGLTVLGYQEYGYQYRFGQANRVSGSFNPYLPSGYSLTNWTMAEKYGSAPSLGSAFIEEDSAAIDRAMSLQALDSQGNVVTSGKYPWWIDFRLDYIATRVMRAHNVPGLTRI